MDLFYIIKWKCSEDGILYNQILEKEKVFDFLQGLNKELDEVKGRILGIKPLPLVKEAFAMVRMEESQRRVMLDSSPVGEETQLGSALVTNQIDVSNHS